MNKNEKLEKLTDKEVAMYENLIYQGLKALIVFEDTKDRQGFVAWLDQADSLKKDLGLKDNNEK